jgi:hypothetical protein
VNALRRRLQPLSWIALVAVLALALLPGLSHALAFAQGEPAPWRAICTAQGKLGQDAPAGNERPAAGHGALEHCAFCNLSGDDALLPSQAVVRGAPVAAGAGAPVDTVRGPLARCTWRAAQPRAPPARA